MLFKPHELRQAPCGAYGVDRAFFQQLCVVFLEISDLLAAAGVRPVDEPAQRLALCIAQDRHMRRRVDGKSLYLTSVDTGFVDAAFNVVNNRVEKVVGVLLEPARYRRIRGILFVRGRTYPARRVEQRGLGRASSEIDAKGHYF